MKCLNYTEEAFCDLQRSFLTIQMKKIHIIVKPIDPYRFTENCNKRYRLSESVYPSIT